MEIKCDDRWVEWDFQFLHYRKHYS